MIWLRRSGDTGQSHTRSLTFARDERTLEQVSKNYAE